MSEMHRLHRMRVLTVNAVRRARQDHEKRPKTWLDCVFSLGIDESIVRLVSLCLDFVMDRAAGQTTEVKVTC